MSVPANPLAKFRSYRYYHVLAICDSTATAESLEAAGLDNPETWLHTEPKDALGRYGVKEVTIPPTDTYQATSTGKYCILINGSTDAQFVITHAKWSSVVEANVTPNDKGTSTAVEGSLKISEPRGVTFADQIVLCCLALGIDSSVAVYALKTFIVGYVHEDVEEGAPDEGDFPTWVNDIPPIFFIPWDLTGTFGPEGGTYEIQFVAMKNGASRLPQYSHIPGGLTIDFAKHGATINIATAIASLQQKINQLYKQYYKCTTDFLRSNAPATIEALNKRAQAGTLSEEVQNTVSIDDYMSRFAEVEYVFVIDPAYSNYIITDQAAQNKSSEKCESPPTIVATPQSSIEDVLRNIMYKSPQVNEEAATGVDQKNGVFIKYQPKIQTSLTSREVGGKMKYVVTYNIRRYAVPKSVAANALSKGGKTQDVPSSLFDQLAGNSREVAENTIEFDYIFSGLNIDILEFDLKMNLGLSYTQTASLTNSLKDQVQQVQSRSIQVSPNNTAIRYGKPVTVPIFFGTHLKSPQFFNTQQPSSRTKAAWTIEGQSSLEMQDVIMKITGNYQLLNTLNKESAPSSTTKEQPQVDDGTDTMGLKSNFKHWGYFPAFAAVNIWMPRNNDDLELFQQAGDPTAGGAGTGEPLGFAKRFWFQGLYYVVCVDNEFDNGVFTQNLHMLAIPPSMEDMTSGQEKPDVSKHMKNCYETETGCGQSTPASTPPVTAAPPPPSEVKSPVVPHTPPGQEGQTYVTPTNPQDSNTALAANNDLSKVRGWLKGNAKFPSGAPEESKQAILKAASHYGIDPVLLARICSYESARTFDPTIPGYGAKQPDGSRNVVGLGLFQFIKPTWKDYANRGKIPGLAPPGNNPPESFYELRKNPELAAYAGAAYVDDVRRAFGGSVTIGELYLSYVAGLGGARSIVQKVRSGQGQVVISPDHVLGYERGKPFYWFKFVANNPTWKQGMTYQGAIDAAEKAMLSTLIDGVKVVQPTKQAPTQTIQKQQAKTTPPPQPQPTTPPAGYTIADIFKRQQDCKVQERAKEDPDKKPCGQNDPGAAGATRPVSPPGSVEAAQKASVPASSGSTQSSEFYTGSSPD